MFGAKHAFHVHHGGFQRHVRNHANADVLQVLRAEHPGFGCSHRQNDLLIWIVEPTADFFEDADHGKGNPAHEDPLTQQILRVLDPQVLGNRRTGHRHPLARQVLGFGKHASVLHIVVEDVGIVGRRTDQARVGIATVVGDLAPILQSRNDGIEILSVLPQRPDIFDFQRQRIAGNTAQEPGFRGDVEHVGAERINLILDLLLRSGARRQHGDNGRHADDDAQHGQARANDIGPDGLQGNP